jgi:hypothetical protein
VAYDYNGDDTLKQLKHDLQGTTTGSGDSALNSYIHNRVPVTVHLILISTTARR